MLPHAVYMVTCYSSIGYHLSCFETTSFIHQLQACFSTTMGTGKQITVEFIVVECDVVAIAIKIKTDVNS